MFIFGYDIQEMGPNKQNTIKLTSTQNTCENIFRCAKKLAELIPTRT